MNRTRFALIAPVIFGGAARATYAIAGTDTPPPPAAPHRAAPGSRPRGRFSVALTSRIPLVRRYVNFDDYWAREVDVGDARPARLRALSAETARAFRAQLVTGLFPYRRHNCSAIAGLSVALLALADR